MKECDKVIDKNGPKKTGGTGIKQLRENIAESKLSYEIMDDAAQVFLKSKIMDNIHKYFYLIAFTAYMRQAAVLAKVGSDEDKAKNGLTGGKTAIPADQLKITKTFVDYMGEHASLRTAVDQGKGKLQWERDIPAAALSTLKLLPHLTSRPTLARSSTTSARPPITCSPTCPRVTTRSVPSTDLLQDSDEDPAC